MFAHKSNCFWKLSLSSLSCLLRLPNYMSLPTVWILIQRGRTDSLSGSWLWLSPDASAWKRKKTVFIKLFLLLQSTFATLHNSNQYSEKGPIIIKLEAVYQAYEAVFHHQMKQLEESWKYDVQRSIFDELRGVSSGDETLCRMLDITSQTKWF